MVHAGLLGGFRKSINPYVCFVNPFILVTHKLGSRSNLVGSANKNTSDLRTSKSTKGQWMAVWYDLMLCWCYVDAIWCIAAFVIVDIPALSRSCCTSWQSGWFGLLPNMNRNGTNQDHLNLNHAHLNNHPKKAGGNWMIYSWSCPCGLKF